MEETAPKPAPPAMDVVAPQAPVPGPVDVKPAPLPTETADPKPKEIKDAAKPVKPPKTAKTPGNGVGVAIMATVIIVLGLAAMATYAYLKTQN